MKSINLLIVTFGVLAIETFEIGLKCIITLAMPSISLATLCVNFSTWKQKEKRTWKEQNMHDFSLYGLNLEKRIWIFQFLTNAFYGYLKCKNIWCRLKLLIFQNINFKIWIGKIEVMSGDRVKNESYKELYFPFIRRLQGGL